MLCHSLSQNQLGTDKSLGVHADCSALAGFRPRRRAFAEAIQGRGARGGNTLRDRGHDSSVNAASNFL